MTTWIARFDPAIKSIVKDLDLTLPLSNAKAKKILGWQPRSETDAITSTASSLIAQNILCQMI